VRSFVEMQTRVKPGHAVFVYGADIGGKIATP
jgi:hypothetical protein